MPSKIKPIPLRLPDDDRAKVAAFAKLTNAKSEHAAILALVRKGLDAPLEVKVRDTPGVVPASALPRPAAPKKRSWSLKGVHFGPVERQPGSMLKKPAAPKARR
jgi:hypothetical protein